MGAEKTDLVLVIDVGNSGAKLGVVRGEDVAGPQPAAVTNVTKSTNSRIRMGSTVQRV